MPCDAVVLLGHLQSIVTSVCVTPDDAYVISTDRETKVRVTVMPQQPLKVSSFEGWCALLL